MTSLCSAVAPFLNLAQQIINSKAEGRVVVYKVRRQGQDLWLVARTFGDVGLFPVITDGLSGVSTADLVDTFNLAGVGTPALAFTNAIFVDVDGGGWKAPFAP